MSHFDIEASKAQLKASERQYYELIKVYDYIMLRAQPGQTFPSIEKQLHDVELSIQRYSLLITNYEDLLDMKPEDDILEEVHRVRFMDELTDE